MTIYDWLSAAWVPLFYVAHDHKPSADFGLLFNRGVFNLHHFVTDSFAMEDQMEPTRLGIIGCGAISGHHLDMAAKLPDVED